MKSGDLLQLQPVQVVVLVVVLLGGFLVGRCTGPEAPQEPVVEVPPPPGPAESEKLSAPVEQSKPSEPEQPGSEPEHGVVEQPPVEPADVDADGAEEVVEPFDSATQCWKSAPDALCWCSCLPEPLPLMQSKVVPASSPAELIPEEGAEEVSEEGQEVQALDEGDEAVSGGGATEEVPPASDVAPHTKVAAEKKGASLSEMPVKVGEKLPEIFLGYDDSICGGDLVPAVRATVADLESQSILYGVGPLSDCSGIFHRVLMGLKKRCPGHDYPPLETYRDSRDLARWYYKRGELILIEDALQHTDLIRPGMVLFYGRGGTAYKNFTVNDLVTTRAGIDHVGVVVSVVRDDDGELVSYKLFHGYGRKGKNTAATTNWHKRNPTKAIYPPFGNGLQQLVAAARIIGPRRGWRRM